MAKSDNRSGGGAGFAPPPEPLSSPGIDAHCHLDVAERFHQPLSLDEALARAASVNVTKIVQIGCDLEGARWAVQAANAHAALVAGVALHPNEIPGLASAGELDAALAEIDRLAASSDRVRVIGETGLDHFRTEESDWAVQETGFRAHIQLAKKHGLALQIHDRDAHADILRVLEDEGPPDRVVFHCFSGDADMARYCVERGYVLSFAGTVTFKNAAPLREALALTPIDQLLVETDAPYLAPMPYRGRPNASYLIPYTLRAIAGFKEVDEAVLADTIASTARRLFGSW